MSAFGHFSLNDRHGWFGAGRRGSFFSGEESDAGTEGGRSPTGVPASDSSPGASPALSLIPARQNDEARELGFVRGFVIR